MDKRNGYFKRGLTRNAIKAITVSAFGPFAASSSEKRSQSTRSPVTDCRVAPCLRWLLQPGACTCAKLAVIVLLADTWAVPEGVQFDSSQRHRSCRSGNDGMSLQ